MRRFLTMVLCVTLSLWGTAAAPFAQPSALSAGPDYTVGARDVLQIAVWKQNDLTGKFEVAEDGMIAFPLLGRVKVAGQKLAAIEQELTRRLGDGYIRDPHVTVTVDTFRSQRVFVLGEVKTPGAIPLTGGMTLVEALVRAGSFSDTLGGEVVVSRSSGEPTGQPMLPGTPGSVSVLTVDLKDLRAGRLGENVSLQDGDTVFVTRAETVFVEGQVANPGAYVLEKGMTVLRLISLAGGTTPIGNANRARVRRLTDGKVSEDRVKLTDVVKAGDTIVVPTRLF